MKKYIALVLILLIIAFYGYLIYQENCINIIFFEVPKKIYLVVGEKTKVNIEIKEENNKKVSLKLISENKEILTTNNDTIKGIKDGKVKLTIKAQNGISKETEVIVTSLITKPNINNEKAYITCGEYSKEESDLLEEILEFKINEAGYQTRAGALTAARFLLLEFKSGIKYFNENGRLENHSEIKYIDGEGRFYHKGLYLTEEKYQTIVSSTDSGPAMWGCKLKNITFNKEAENGLNCSGFITWALYNAGYDIKDVGAGDYPYINNELLDLKPKEKITIELLESNKIKVGDLIGFDGHIAMIIGMKDSTLYIGESYETGLRVRKFSYEELINSDFTDIILMDDFYKNEGNYKNMW